MRQAEEGARLLSNVCEVDEAERFPDLASEWYRRGPEQSATLFASWFERPGERGLLNVPDTQLAAQMFNWLVLPMPVNKAMAVVGKPEVKVDALKLALGKGIILERVVVGRRWAGKTLRELDLRALGRVRGLPAGRPLR